MEKKKILVVDDEIGILAFVKDVLVKKEYFVQTTINPFEVVDILKSTDFDIAIVDLRMPGMSGLDLLETIKENHKKIEVIIITADATVETTVECMKKGASDFLVKPFEISELLATIERTLEISNLKSQLVNLQEMDKLKDEFISTVSHELRTPLTAISGAIEFLSDKEKIVKEKRKMLRRQDDNDTQKLLEIIERQSGKMRILVNDLLDFAKMEAGFVNPKKSKIQIMKIVKDAIREVQSLADTKKIEVMERSSLNIDINCNYEDIKRVIVNLLINSIKYTQEGGMVSVSFEEIDGEIKFVIADNGKGITKENMGKVFEKFFRVDQSLTRESGGFGLGLSICRKIIELHGGKIWAESDGLGKGSKFIFTLPI
ncbi:MAG: response regulator [Elusimicrobia bacterium]|nr:response regulator [Elusimicrobiota bacterium]